MKKIPIVLLVGLLLVGGASSVSAAAIDLYEYAFNIDGTVSSPLFGDPLPAAVDISGFDDVTGLGSIAVAIGGAGAHFVDGFFDIEIDELINTYFNESGASSGVAAAGQSWEIDEPDFVFGDIFANFVASALDNSNGVPAGLEDDVAMAIGWDFTLAAGETATIDFILGEIMPAGFFLSHTDPDSNATIYFSSALDITGGGDPGVPIPEPATIFLLGTGLAGLAGMARKKFS